MTGATRFPERIRRASHELAGRTRLLAVVLLGLCTGCQSFKLSFWPHDKTEIRAEVADPVVPPLPGKFGFRLAPYAFFSDFEVNRDQPLFHELAGLRDQVYKELRLTPGTNEVKVYLFENKERYDNYIRARYPGLPDRRAFFVAQGRRGVTKTEDLLVYTYWTERIQQDLRHELTHALLHSVLKDVPLWLDEGLAEYFELAPDKNGQNQAHIEMLRRETANGDFKPDLTRLESIQEVAGMGRLEYREAWAWVHLMLRSTPEARTVLLQYLQQLRTTATPGPLAPKLAAVHPALNEVFDKHLTKLDKDGVKRQ